MLIQKTSQSIQGGQILNEQSTSSNNTYSCSYLNNKLAPKFFKCRATADQTPNASRYINATWGTVDINSGDYFWLSQGGYACCNEETHLVRWTVTLWIEGCNKSYAWVTVYTNDLNLTSGASVGCYMLGKTSSESWQSVTLTGICYMGTSTTRTIYPQIYYNVADATERLAGGTYAGSCYMTLEVID